MDVIVASMPDETELVREASKTAGKVWFAPEYGICIHCRQKHATIVLKGHHQPLCRDAHGHAATHAGEWRHQHKLADKRLLGGAARRLSLPGASGVGLF